MPRTICSSVFLHLAIRHASGPSAATVQGWITSIATAVLAVLAIIAAIVAGLALRKQSRELAILVAENKRQGDERRRAQAESVFIGLPIRGPRMVQPSAQNASNLPIHDAQFWSYGPNGLSGPEDLGMIMPGPVGINGGQMRYDDAVERMILTFRDAEGLRWIRRADGTLEEQSRSTARESILAALGRPRVAPADPAGEPEHTGDI